MKTSSNPLTKDPRQQRGAVAVLVALMLPATEAEGQPRIKGEGNSADGIVATGAPRPQHAMHGIVSDDEQAGLQLSTQQHQQQCSPPGLPLDAGAEQNGQGEQPGQKETAAEQRAHGQPAA